ncbi:MAG: UDP-N-acetylmuramoyl-tripeptide--D-alanyl-D-alanine ligase [Treponemataceae bacterium]|nr:UDP-N-acetylmuramoyl-tripeptide--D-alanyl-D-alanine ligase [Treponemataceae bacterium]
MNSLLTLDELCSATEGKLWNTAVCSTNFSFTNVATDSRNVTEHTLFVPLIGENQDGHAYIQQAFDKGASAVFAAEVSSDRFGPVYDKLTEKGLFVIIVKNTLTALQKAAARYVEKFPELIKIGITGSNGKTTTKELAKNVVGAKYNVIATEGNFNSETGLPLSVFRIRRSHEAGIFEMGMNRVDEIGELAAVLKPRYAIITNVGTAHIGILGSREAIAAEKKKIFSFFDGASVGFVPEDDSFVEFLKNVTAGTVKTFGISSMNEISEVKDLGFAGTEFALKNRKITLSLNGSYNFKNCLGVVALAEELGLSPEEIKAGIEKTVPLFGRSAVKHGKFTVVEDCYNANGDSMEAAIGYYGSMQVPGKKVLVLGDMFELGEHSDAVHKKMARCAKDSGADTVVFVGEAMTKAFNAVEKENSFSAAGVNAMCCPSADDGAVSSLCDSLCALLEEGDLVLVKGSRGMKLERITDRLEKEAGV